MGYKKYNKELALTNKDEYMLTRTYTVTYKRIRYNNIKYRCGNKPNIKQFERYKDVKCNISFNEFDDWFESNYYEVPNTKFMDIDKDIRLFGIKKSKEYSVNTMLVVPCEINSLFATFNPMRDVKFDKKNNEYYYKYYKDKITGFRTKEEAIKSYCNLKNAKLKFYIEKFKSKMPNDVLAILESKDFNNYKFLYDKKGVA